MPTNEELQLNFCTIIDEIAELLNKLDEPNLNYMKFHNKMKGYLLLYLSSPPQSKIREADKKNLNTTLNNAADNLNELLKGFKIQDDETTKLLNQHSNKLLQLIAAEKDNFYCITKPSL